MTVDPLDRSALEARLCRRMIGGIGFVWMESNGAVARQRSSGIGGRHTAAVHDAGHSGRTSSRGAVVPSGAALGGGTELAIGTIYALCIQAYAADHRATGLGAALVVGRIGGFAAAATGGASIASSVGGQALHLLILIGIAAVALGASSLIQRHVAARRRLSDG